MWSFRKYTDAGWTWRHQSGSGFVLGQSLYYFDDLEACQLDARRYGYSADQPSSVVSADTHEYRLDRRDNEPNHREEHLSFRERLLQGRLE